MSASLLRRVVVVTRTSSVRAPRLRDRPPPHPLLRYLRMGQSWSFSNGDSTKPVVVASTTTTAVITSAPSATLCDSLHLLLTLPSVAPSSAHHWRVDFEVDVAHHQAVQPLCRIPFSILPAHPLVHPLCIPSHAFVSAVDTHSVNALCNVCALHIILCDRTDKPVSHPLAQALVLVMHVSLPTEDVPDAVDAVDAIDKPTLLRHVYGVPYVTPVKTTES